MHAPRSGKRQRRPAGPGGLSGKARRNRSRGRAFRFQAQQMIDEFLESEPQPSHSDRYIPIRGRSDFLPSAKCPGSEAKGGAVDARSQPEAHSKPIKRPAIKPASRSGNDPQQCYALVSSKGPLRERLKLDLPVIRPPRPPQKPEQPAEPVNFTVRGFLYGCAMGSAAAAVLLLLVQIVLP